jgi:LysM repeat protein
VALLIVAILLVVGFISMIARNQYISDLNARLTASAAASSLATPPPATHTLPPPSTTPTNEPSITPTAANTPTPTDTSTPAQPTQGPNLETPFGPRNEFILHRVETGESLNYIASQYKTSVAVITSTNELRPGYTLLIGKILVIIPDLKENPGLPIFRPVYLDKDASLSALVQEYGISPNDLWRYNSLGSSDLIPAGRWIIIPLPSGLGP